MKLKPFFFLIVLLLLAWQASAQRLYLIPSVGYNLSTISTIEGSVPRDGINVGLGAELAFSHRVSMETGAYYSMQGVSFPFSNRLTDDYSLEVINNYINVPLLFKGYVVKGLHLAIGPQIGFLINGKQEVSFTQLMNNRNRTTEDILDRKILELTPRIIDDINPIDVSAVISLGYQFAFGLNLTTKVNLGMNNVLKTSHNELYDLIFPKKKVIHNNVFQLNLGWRF